VFTKLWKKCFGRARASSPANHAIDCLDALAIKWLDFNAGLIFRSEVTLGQQIWLFQQPAKIYVSTHWPQIWSLDDGVTASMLIAMAPARAGTHTMEQALEAFREVVAREIADAERLESFARHLREQISEEGPGDTKSPRL
jgi:hypothetical protein